MKKSLKILTRQPELRPYENELRDRNERCGRKLRELCGSGSLSDFADGYLYFGLHRTENGWVCREWAPGAEAMHLIGDFNGWNRESHPLHRLPGGAWEIELPEDALSHLQSYKLSVMAHGETNDRIPPYAFYVRQDWATHGFNACVWAPEKEFEWHDGDFHPETNLPPFIYEAHIGMATEERRVGSYREFAENILPRIKADGYNTVQLMGIMEHPYYGSFGYHVSSFFAASSRFGTPDELKYLVDQAHGMGISVFLDLVHSHAVKNTMEGINLFDGTTEQFFKSGAEGEHPAWDSKLFDYGKNGVLHFLLSDLKFWLEEYHFDGFRFDGVGSMLYKHHGLGVSFGEPEEYFGSSVDRDAVTYLQLASRLVREVKPGAVLIAEDVSAMPGLCLPVSEGGIGFDYRLSMGLPDWFARAARDRRYGEWEMGRLCWELTARRNGEKLIAYAESHDQAMMGDQTLIFRLAGAEMYTAMDRKTPNLTVQNACAMHKLIRLLTVCAGGDGYLNFMGNEFGHPEWIDFPREGNGWSHEHARRQWSLADDPALRYRELGEFDKAMITLMKENAVLNAQPKCLLCREKEQLLAFRRGEYVFAFNLHPTASQEGLFLPVPAGEYVPVLSSDESRFGGWDNIGTDCKYMSKRKRPGTGFHIYLPAMTAVVLHRENKGKQTAQEAEI